MTEVGSAIRDVLANEMPQMVRHAVSESLYELLTTTTKGAAKADSPRNKAIEAKPAKRKAATKKTATKKAAAKKATRKATSKT